MLYRQTPQAIIGHTIASGLIVFALWPVVSHEMLLLWLTGVISIGVVRSAACLLFLRQWPIDDDRLPAWTLALSVLAFLQTFAWGISVFVIWPEASEYRSLLMASLAGVIAAGGVMLATHRLSFVIYCLPIALPALYKLITTGGRIEFILAGLVVLYSILLIVAVTRLGNSFFQGIVVRLQMESLSRLDPLTHIANRRGFDEYIEGIWQNAIRSRQSIGLIVADIDYFKSYNDRYGHPRGDVALTRLASVLTNAAGRTTDLCARIGGEEFAIVLPSTDEEGTRLIAEHIQHLLAEASVTHPSSPFGYLTLSMGYGAIVPNRDDSAEAFYAKVDKALYTAKRNGRNRIELAA